MASGKVDNANINRAWRSKWIPASQFITGSLGVVTVDQGPPVTATVANTLVNAGGTGVPVFSNLGTPGQPGFTVANGNTLTGITFADLDDVDWSIAPGFSVLLTSGNATPTGTVTPTIGYRLGKLQSQKIGTSTFPSGSPVSLAFAAQTFTTQYLSIESEIKHFLPANTITPRQATDAQYAINVGIGFALSGTISPVYFLGLKFFYVPLIGATASASGPGSTTALGFTN